MAWVDQAPTPDNRSTDAERREPMPMNNTSDPLVDETIVEHSRITDLD